MFANATSFNQDLSGWNTSQGKYFVSQKVESVNAIECESLFHYLVYITFSFTTTSLPLPKSRTFYYASSFNQDVFQVKQGISFVSLKEVECIDAIMCD
jgi:surface protein